MHGLLRRSALTVDGRARHVHRQSGGQPTGAGDVAGLRSGAAAQASQTCLDSLRSSARISAVLRDFEAAWLKTVTDSLERNTVTLAVADIDGLLRPGGLLAKLRARGYEIDEP